MEEVHMPLKLYKEGSKVLDMMIVYTKPDNDFDMDGRMVGENYETHHNDNVISIRRWVGATGPFVTDI